MPSYVKPMGLLPGPSNDWITKPASSITFRSESDFYNRILVVIRNPQNFDPDIGDSWVKKTIISKKFDVNSKTLLYALGTLITQGKIETISL